MVTIIGVRFKEIGKIYYFDPSETQYAIGQRVVVETSRGIELATVAIPNSEVAEDKVVQPLRGVLRFATDADETVAQANKKRAAEAFTVCEKKIAEHGLDMKLIETECTFDGSKMLFYFTSDGRVDFRELVRDLASIFHMRIELRQIGVRDEARLYGGLGICGRALCCASFLDDFQPVSIKMAKEQSLSLNPTKISGTCGRLMCCLKYEEEAYIDLLKSSPRVGATVQTPDGQGTVIDVNLLRGLVKVSSGKQGEAAKTYPKADCKIIPNNK